MTLFFVKLYNILQPAIAFAQNPIEVGGDDTVTTQSGGTVQNIPIEFTNPLGGNGSVAGINSLTELIAAILQIVITVGIPLIVLAIIYTGFLFVSAMGDKGKIEKAREAFTYVIIGAIILLASWVIAEAVDGTIQQIINS